MAEIISFKKKASQLRKKKAKGGTLCGNGHHDWQTVKEQQFDSKKGKLVTLFRCTRCGKEKVKAL